MGHSFTYVPANAMKHHMHHKQALGVPEADSVSLHDPNVSDDDQESPGIVSLLCIQLINECSAAVEEIAGSSLRFLFHTLLRCSST